MWVRVWSALPNGGGRRVFCEMQMFPAPGEPLGANRINMEIVKAMEDALQRWGNAHIEHIEPAARAAGDAKPLEEPSTLIGE